MKNIQILVLLVFFCFACNKKKTDIKQNNIQYNRKSTQFDSLKVEKKEKKQNIKGLNLLKSIVKLENKANKSNSMKFYNKDSISDFIFIRDLFPREEIDSIEFYGAFNKQRIHSKNIPETSLLIIYFNYKRFSKMRINLLEFEWNDKLKAPNTFFETGAIVFELDKQLCIYTANNCNENHENIVRIDSIIKTELNRNLYKYERIITNCGKVSFKRQLN